jgi:hypothetical protein
MVASSTMPSGNVDVDVTDAAAAVSVLNAL